MNLAVIDLGTNTFHLLIAEVKDGKITPLYKERIFVYLAEHSIQTIHPQPFQRGIDALLHFSSIIQQYHIQAIKAFGTAALRTASNAAQFCEQAAQQAGIHIDIIGGLEEARLICLGVRQAVPMTNRPALIMDIGGGSVEFIIASKTDIFWEQSFPIGISVLYNQFKHAEPITPAELQNIQTYLHQQIAPVRQALQQYPSLHTLIGASGTFDVLHSILGTPNKHANYTSFPAETFYPLYHQILQTTLSERLTMKTIPDERARLIVVALILIEVTLQLAPIQQIQVSDFAMKQGILYQMATQIK